MAKYLLELLDAHWQKKENEIMENMILSTKMKTFKEKACNDRDSTSADKKACKKVIQNYQLAKSDKVPDFALKKAFDAIIFMERNIFDKVKKKVFVKPANKQCYEMLTKFK